MDSRLYEAGYAGADWPTEFGGRDDRSAGARDRRRRGAGPCRGSGVQGGGALAAHALIHFGTEEQRRRRLPEIRAGRELWCQFSVSRARGATWRRCAPRAVRRRRQLHGQRTEGLDHRRHWAHYGYLLARTDPDAPKHKGISAFIVDMSTPGVTVRPLRELTGTSDFNEVFLDDVQVPADAMIGSPGQGWRIANATLATSAPASARSWSG